MNILENCLSRESSVSPRPSRRRRATERRRLPLFAIRSGRRNRAVWILLAPVFLWSAAIVRVPALQAEEEDSSLCEARLAELKGKFEAAKDEGPEVRFPLILEFASAPCDATVEYLEGFYKKDENPGVLMAVTQTLGRIGSKRAIEVVFSKALPLLHDDAFARQAIAEALENRLPEEAEEWVVDNLRKIREIESLRKDEELWKRIVRGLVGFRTEKKFRLLIDELKRPGAPEIKIALLGALEEVRNSQVVAQAKALLRAKEPEVQAAALFCLYYQDSRRNVAAFTRGLRSKDWQVRLASLRILSDMGHKDAVEHATKLLDDPDKKVRITAVRALLKVGGKEAVGALIAAMPKAEDRLLDDIADALARLTGRNLGAIPVQWESWWVQYKDQPGNYQAMSLESYARLLAKEAQKQTLLYYGLRVLSNHVVFIIDTSESMKDEYVPAPAEGEGRTVVVNPPGGEGTETRMDVAKKELAKVVKHLEEGKTFDIVGFDSVIKDFIPDILGKDPEELERMDGATRERALGFVDSLGPAGQTFLLRALRQAFSYADLDTIYLLSDGAPTPSSGTMEEIVAWVARENRLRNVRINAIGFGLEAERDAFLRELTGENFGVFIER